MIRKKHESSLLEVFSDAGSTPAASTISKSFTVNDLSFTFKFSYNVCTMTLAE